MLRKLGLTVPGQGAWDGTGQGAWDVTSQGAWDAVAPNGCHIILNPESRKGGCFMSKKYRGVKGFRRPLIPCTKVHRKKKGRGAYRRFSAAERKALLKLYAAGQTL